MLTICDNKAPLVMFIFSLKLSVALTQFFFTTEWLTFKQKSLDFEELPKDKLADLLQQFYGGVCMKK